MLVPTGISAADIGALRALIAQILPCDTPDDVPFTAPLLILAQLNAAQRRALVAAAAGQAVIQEQLVIEAAVAVSPGEPIEVQLESAIEPTLRRLRINLVHPAGAAFSSITATLRVVDAATLSRGLVLPLSRSSRGASTTLSEPFSISAGQVARYVAFAGDENPLHTDPAHAASLGFAHPLVPGALLAALAQGLVAGHGRLARLGLRFTAPVLVGETLQVAVERRGEALRLHYCNTALNVVAIADVTLA